MTIRATVHALAFPLTTIDPWLARERIVPTTSATGPATRAE